jgi:hypothetical protein
MFERINETKGIAKSQLAGRKNGRVTKEATKKIRKDERKNMIKIGESKQ